MSVNGKNKGKFIKIIRFIFVIPVPLVLFLAVISFPSVGYILYNENTEYYIELLTYVLSAYAFTVLCIRTPYMYRRTKELITGDYIYLIVLTRKIMRKFKYSRMYLEDVEFRASIALYLGFCINTFYAIIRFYDGLKNESIWFAAIGVYYFIFGLIRSFLIRRNRNRRYFEDITKEQIYSIKTYRVCGVLMFVLNITMAGMIIQMIVKNEKINEYTINQIYYSAMYTFYSVFISIYNMIKFRKDKNEILSASKNLNFVGTLMSIFTLQTSMLLIFNDGQVEIQKMNTLTGAIIIVFSTVIAIYMITKANRKLCNLYEG